MLAKLVDVFNLLLWTRCQSSASPPNMPHLPRWGFFVAKVKSIDFHDEERMISELNMPMV